MAGLIIRTVLSVLVRFELILMLVRALMSWFTDGGGFIYGLTVAVTEPVIYPIRVIFDGFMPKKTLTTDVPFIAAFFLLSLTELILGLL